LFIIYIGLKETKRTLLETLEWPTKYSAIFANSSLRLRSGYVINIYIYIFNNKNNKIK